MLLSLIEIVIECESVIEHRFYLFNWKASMEPSVDFVAFICFNMRTLPKNPGVKTPFSVFTSI
jgi:hypothetical protein